MSKQTIPVERIVQRILYLPGQKVMLDRDLVALYGVTLAADASQLAGAPNGPFGLLSTATSLVVQLVVMGAAGGLAVTSTMRGRQGLH